MKLLNNNEEYECKNIRPVEYQVMKKYNIRINLYDPFLI